MTQTAATQVRVGIGEMAVTREPAEQIVTYALGSCLGITLHDPLARVGGMLHAMLPQSTLDPEKARTSPARFVDTGVPALFRACYALGASKERLVLKVAGGASMQDAGADSFEIGRRNLLMLRQLLWKNGVLIRGQDVGGDVSRTLVLDVASGATTVRSNGQVREL